VALTLRWLREVDLIQIVDEELARFIRRTKTDNILGVGEIPRDCSHGESEGGNRKGEAWWFGVKEGMSNLLDAGEVNDVSKVGGFRQTNCVPRGNTVL